MKPSSSYFAMVNSIHTQINNLNSKKMKKLKHNWPIVAIVIWFTLIGIIAVKLG